MSVWSSWFQRRLQPISAAQVWMKFLACQVSELGLQVQHVPALITDLLSVSTSVKATGQGYLKSESNFQWETLTEYLYRGLIKSFVTCCDEGHLKLFISKVLCPRFEETPSRRPKEITFTRFGQKFGHSDLNIGPLTTSGRSWETSDHKTGTRMDKTKTSSNDRHQCPQLTNICSSVPAVHPVSCLSPQPTDLKWFSITHPGIPPDSSLLAMSTSQDQTSNCHFLSPNTPHSTEPEWIPIRMSMSCFVRDRTYLEENTRSQSSVVRLQDHSHHMLNRRMKTKSAGKIIKIYRYIRHASLLYGSVCLN